jgi:predicted nuclease of predicted toxin-antitoxin system
VPGLDHFVPILVDECVPYRVAVWLRDAGYEASHVTEVGRRGHPDHSQLEYAAERGMLLLTYNVADFLELDAEWRMTGKFHAGILLANDSTYQRYPRALVNDVRATLSHYAELHRGDVGWLHNRVWWVRRGDTSE